MHIVALSIRNFRGVRELQWHPNQGVNTLIGPGDSCKTTILDAIDLLLAERQNVTFDDLDFYEANPANAIRIIACIASLPTEYLREDRYGLYLSGWNPTTLSWSSEPAESSGVNPVLTLELVVDETLEPVWSIYLGSTPDDKSKRIRSADRKEMAPARLGVYADRHLSWGRGSALQRVGAHPERLPAQLSELLRSARDTFSAKGAATFSDIIETVSPDIKALGVQVRDKLTANLDHTSFSMNASGVALHDGNVPFRCMGTGSARLAVAALQSAESAGREFLLVDEIEYGLEPHRISLLVSHLRKRVETSGQVFLTTHSTSVLREVRFGEVFVCRRDATGKVEVKASAATATAPLEAKRYVRDLGEALLTKSVLVCEGQTEVAFLKGYAEGTNRQFQMFGATVIDGGGASTPAVALHFASLGYRTALLTDSDAPVPPAFVTSLKAKNVAHFEWGDNRCTEEELFMGTPPELRPRLLELITSEIGEPRALGEMSSAVRQKVETLQQAYVYLSDENWLRQIGRLAHKSKWIKKDYDLCFRIGSHLATHAVHTGAPAHLPWQLSQIFYWLCSNA
ncbi:ATP-dependent nuclease [Burkholderia lata]|uniref:DNA replication and repair protein RecF n=1 Tax=Burkholderia lata (strain ATCC 17760 / DSM 23089 / LMG 22485 / NCIMB 9086 / R18194 / 383) TaxID=482957 RepID=A0A6P2XM51_BURL3|nr:ATP-binding protein [Burkholderia lata]VWD09335.1 DNA replication and repair protein RecF [Burkholderia lata]